MGHDAACEADVQPVSLPRPPGYVAPPPANLPDSLRSRRVLFTDLLPHRAKLALYPNLPSTNRIEGLAHARVAFGQTLRRLGRHIHGDRSDEAQWRASVARAAEMLTASACILVSPGRKMNQNRNPK